MALIGAAILFGSTGAFVVVLSQYYTQPGQLVVRSAVAAILVFLLAKMFAMPFSVRRDQIKYLLAIGLLYAGSTTCFIYAVTSTKASTALFMLYVGVVATTQLLGVTMFRERFGIRNIITMILLLGAFTIYTNPTSSEFLSIGLGTAFIGGVLEAVTYAVRKRKTTMTKESITLAQSLGGLVVGVVILAINTQPIFSESFSLVSLLPMLVLGLIYVGIGYLITYGMRHYSLSMGSVILSADLLFALVINAAILHQIPTALELVGSVILFACIVYASDASILRRIRKKSTTNDIDEDAAPAL